MKRYFKAFGYLLSVHVLALLVMTCSSSPKWTRKSQKKEGAP